jgi:hypothetical protein
MMTYYSICFYRNELNNTLQEVDDCKMLYVKVCEEKNKMEKKMKVEMEESLSDKLKKVSLFIELYF